MLSAFQINCMGTIRKVYDFFNTPKLQSVLYDKITNKKPCIWATKFKKLCPTSWVSSENVFLELFDSVLFAMEEISNTLNYRDMTSGALMLQSNLQKCEFLLSLFVVHKKMFSFTLHLSNENLEEEIHFTFEKVKQMCTKYEIPVNFPRAAGK
ncbi:hypothetical protein PR048_023379 [Dryococelus australis]|uniref:Uncharacterized protein n=1 Tax=Dryococelus australis TaxID=614101 RepID=A0ABQ9GU26_9NEOP|nr:hypothetical protein PR048_023379 [Dryococelus australis]